MKKMNLLGRSIYVPVQRRKFSLAQLHKRVRGVYLYCPADIDPYVFESFMSLIRTIHYDSGRNYTGRKFINCQQHEEALLQCQIATLIMRHNKGVDDDVFGPTVFKVDHYFTRSNINKVCLTMTKLRAVDQ